MVRVQNLGFICSLMQLFHGTVCLLELHSDRSCKCHLPDDTLISCIIEKYWKFKDMTTLNGHAYNFSLSRSN